MPITTVWRDQTLQVCPRLLSEVMWLHPAACAARHRHIQPVGHTPLHMRLGGMTCAPSSAALGQALPPSLPPFNFFSWSGCHIPTDGELAYLLYILFFPLSLSYIRPTNNYIGGGWGERNETPRFLATTAVRDAEDPAHAQFVSV